MTTLNFTEVNGVYTSDLITGEGTVLLHIAFDDDKQGSLTIERSIDQSSGFAVVLNASITTQIYEETIAGLVSAISLRIKLTKAPTLAQYVIV